MYKIKAKETSWYKAAMKRLKPSDLIKIYRSNLKLSKKQLAKKINKQESFISDLESNKITASEDVENELSAIFDIPVEMFKELHQNI